MLDTCDTPITYKDAIAHKHVQGTGNTVSLQCPSTFATLFEIRDRFPEGLPLPCLVLRLPCIGRCTLSLGLTWDAQVRIDIGVRTAWATGALCQAAWQLPRICPSCCLLVDAASGRQAILLHMLVDKVLLSLMAAELVLAVQVLSDDTLNRQDKETMRTSRSIAHLLGHGRRWRRQNLAAPKHSCPPCLVTALWLQRAAPLARHRCRGCHGCRGGPRALLSQWPALRTCAHGVA